MNEPEFRPVVGYENWYEIGNNGEVISLVDRYGRPQRHTLTPRIVGSGYLGVVLCNRINNRNVSVIVHRLVAESFLPNSENKPTVNHKNGIKTDNRAENLEWATRSENTRHAVANGLMKYHKGSANKAAKLTEDRVRKIRALFSEGKTNRYIAALMKIGSARVSDIRTGKNWAHVV